MTDGQSRFVSIWRRIHEIWIRVGLAALVLMPIAAYLMFRAHGLPPDTWVSTDSLSVHASDDALLFEARTTSGERIVLLPGCPVEAKAYAPLARGLAQRGLTTFVVKVPYRCAPFSTHVRALQERLRRLLATCVTCSWTIAGHSRGVRHALEAVEAMPTSFRRLVLIASTHPRERDFSRLSIPVQKIQGTHDGVAPLAASEANRRLLPPTTRWDVIDGANHSQFSYYGFQLFDSRATISRDEQHARAIAAVVSFIGDNK